MPVVPDGSEGPVILDNGPSMKRISPRIHHFFTFNNYDGSTIPILIKVFDELCYMYAFQEEKGANGTRHLQGIISLKKKMRDTEFGLPKAIHWEKPHHVPESYIYCTKEETRCGNVYVKNYRIPYTFKLKNLYDWQENLLEILNEIPDPRKVLWYWSKVGSVGKSQFCKHLVMNNNAVLLTKGKYSDICNLIYKSDMYRSRIVIFDLPRNNGNSISYDAIESIKNGMICNTKYETGSICFEPPHVLIFANEPPEIEKLSKDRWIIKELY